jgi:hypothetical protein
MIINPYLVLPSVSYDPDAQAFFNAQAAAGVTLTTTQKDAVNQWVVDAKAAGIWTKMKAIYPFVGGTATSHKFNLKNPADTNAAFRLSFVGGWTHSASGALPNGTNAYADTFLIPSTALSTMSQHISYYSRTNNTSAAILDNGCQDDVFPSIGRNIYAQYYNSLTLSRVQIQSLDANSVPFAETNSLGFILGSRTSATSFKAYRNNLLKGTNTTNSTSGLCGNSVYIGGFNYRNNFGTTIYYGIRQCAFASIGDGLSDAEALTLYNAVQTFQTTLNRQVI